MLGKEYAIWALVTKYAFAVNFTAMNLFISNSYQRHQQVKTVKMLQPQQGM